MKNSNIIYFFSIICILFLLNCNKDECGYGIDSVIVNTSRCTICEDSTFNKVGDSTSCEKKTTQASSFNGSQFILQAGDRITSYGWGGANVYSVTPSQFPLSTASSGNTMLDGSSNTVAPDANLTGDWQGTSATTGRLNTVGVWSPGIPSGQWIGFSSCIDVVSKKKVCIGIAADNRCRFKLNNTMVAEFNNGNTFNFTHWQVFEIELQTGVNIIEMQGYNNGSYASFGAEIYDASLSQLQTFTTNSQIDASLIFSTKDQLGKLTTIGDLNGYSCPLGFAVDFCSGDTIPVCTMIEKGRVIPCP